MVSFIDTHREAHGPRRLPQVVEGAAGPKLAEALADRLVG